MSWQPYIPGTDVSRLDVLNLALRAYNDVTNYTIRRPYVMRDLCNTSVLTVGQLAAVFDMHRQTMYVHLLRQRLELPKHTVRGTLNPVGLDLMREVVRGEILGNPVTPMMKKEMRRYCTPALIKHLTGITHPRNRPRKDAE